MRSLVRRLWRRPRSVLVSVRDRVRSRIRRLAARHRWFSGFYFGFVNRELDREARAMVAGQLRYTADNSNAAGSYYLLRRNVHRLEKGLIMRPARPVFATDYIEETVDIYERAKAAAGEEWNSELAWAEDVLSDYFDTVDLEHPQLASVHSRFAALPARAAPTNEQVRQQRLVPFTRGAQEPPVPFDDLLSLAVRRRSVRWYQDRPVSRELVDRALEIARQAPSACNRQPFHFRIFDERERVQRVMSIPMGTRGWLEGVPAVAVVVGQLRAYPFERDRHIIYIDGALAAMSFMFALESLGLASCPINWPDQEPHESKMKRTLGLADDERVVMLISFGYADEQGRIPFSAKRDIKELRRFG